MIVIRIKRTDIDHCISVLLALPKLCIKMISFFSYCYLQHSNCYQGFYEPLIRIIIIEYTTIYIRLANHFGLYKELLLQIIWLLFVCSVFFFIIISLIFSLHWSTSHVILIFKTLLMLECIYVVRVNASKKYIYFDI